MNNKWRLSQQIKGYRIYQQLAPISGFLIDCPKHGINIKHFVYFQKNDEGFLYFYPEEYKLEGKKFFKNFLDNQNLIKSSLIKIFKYSDDLRNFALKLKTEKIHTMSDKELFKLYKEFHKYHSLLWRIAMIPNILEFENHFLSDYLFSYLTLKVGKEQAPHLFSNLLYKNRKSELQKRDEKLVELIDYIKRNKIIKIKTNIRVRNFYKKYNYLTYNWSGPAQTFEDFVNEIENLLNSKQMKEKYQIKEKKHKNYSNLQIDEYYIGLFKILKDIIFSKSYRMESSYFAYYHMEKLFKEIGLRLNLSIFQAQSIPPEKMERILVNKKYSLKEINNFTKLGLYYKKGNKINFISGKRAKNKLEKIIFKENKYQFNKFLNGQIAFPGKVSGIVKIVNNKEEMNKFNSGDILVSSFTDPTLMPVIRKCGGIITDVGGMTCHATIVSRELKIPCIVGTKIATKVLKDGDLVEVDANKGVIKILKRQK